MSRGRAALVWAVIAAAFIGPGTVTTAASAGARFGATLLWTLTFSALACFVLQEASARLAIDTGEPLGRSLVRGASGWRRPAIQLLIGGAILLGCAAYQTGNLLGAALGVGLVRADVPVAAAVGSIALFAAALLALGAPERIARALGVGVLAMAVAFLVAAAGVGLPEGAARGLLIPTWPAGGATLALGLVGTTVVPYNLFLGSGLARGARIAEVRFGLGLSIAIGAAVSMAILIVGAGVGEPFSLDRVAGHLADQVGPAARWAFALGLAAAGLSSAVTAPLAAALTAASLFSDGKADRRWRHDSWRFRATWLGVLAAGAGFGMAGVRPVPAIVAAQAFNGVLLPVVALFLWAATRSRARRDRRRSRALGVTAVLTVWLGVRGLSRAVAGVVDVEISDTAWTVASGAISLIVAVWMLRRGRSVS